MFSTAVIDGPFSVALIDASRDQDGVASRVVAVLAKRGVALATDHPLAVLRVDDLHEHAGELASASCVVLLAGPSSPPGLCAAIWSRLEANPPGSKLAVVVQWGATDGPLANDVLNAKSAWASVAVANDAPVSPREAALFLLKFLVEVDLHSDGRTTGRMGWFAWKKADELLKRRRMSAHFALRA